MIGFNVDNDGTGTLCQHQYKVSSIRDLHQNMREHCHRKQVPSVRIDQKYFLSILSPLVR